MELSPVLNLDIGGKRFRVLRTTVMKHPNSLLAKVVTGRDVDHMVIFDGAYYFDRNPKFFSVILDYMRIGKLFLPADLHSEQLQEELKFWQIPELLNPSFANHSPGLAYHADHRTEQKISECYEEPTLVIPDYLEPSLLPQTGFAQTILMSSPKIEPTQLIEEPPSIDLLQTLVIESTLSNNQNQKIEEIVLTKSNKLKESKSIPEEDDLLCSIPLTKRTQSEKIPEIMKSRTLPWSKPAEAKTKKEENFKAELEKDTKTKDAKVTKPKPTRLSKTKSDPDSNNGPGLEKTSDSISSEQTSKRKNLNSEVKKIQKKPTLKKSDLPSEADLLKELENSGS